MATGSERVAGRMPVALFSVASAVVLVSDLLSKKLAFSRLDPAAPLPVIPGLLNLRISRNMGAVFGIGQGLTWLFIIFTILACAVIVWTVWTYGRSSRVLTCALGLVFGGALGNLWDRIIYGYVRDFIDLYVGRYHWPTFNVADSAICIGAALIVIHAFLSSSRSQDGAS